MLNKSLILLLLASTTNVFSQMIVDRDQLTRKGDTVFLTTKLYTGKAIRRKRSDTYKDPIIGEEYFKNGLADGLWKEWYVSGEKKFEGAFKNGVNDGIWIEWNIDGTVKRKLTFNNGLLIESKQK